MFNRGVLKEERVSIETILETLKEIDAGAFEIIKYRREAVGSDHRIMEYVTEKLPGRYNPTESKYAQVFILTIRLMYTSDLMSLWNHPDDVVVDRFFTLLDDARLVSGPFTEDLVRLFDKILDPSKSTGIVDERLNNASRDAWKPEHFTDPRTATSTTSTFRFLITALRTDMVGLTPEMARRYLNGRKRAYVVDDGSDRFDNARYMLNLRDEAPSEVISCSVIENGRCKTYRNMCFGMVLNVPANNILRAERSDIETSGVQNAARARHNSDFSRIQQLTAELNYWELVAGQCRETLPTPSSILDGTRGHNEVVVLGEYDLRTTTVSAVFVKTHRGMIWQDFFGKEGSIAAVVLKEVRKGLPIVAIEDPSRPASKVPFHEWKLGHTQPLGSVKTGQTCSQCRQTHGWTPSVVRHWHECSVCRAVFCWSCGWSLKYYQARGLGEVMAMMEENYLNPGVRACGYCDGRTRHV